MPRFILLLPFILLLTSCGGHDAPKTFIKTTEPGWNVVELRQGLGYVSAWETTVDTLAKKFDIEVMSREEGYVRTGWNYGWTGSIQEWYRVRATVKFSPDRTRVEIKSEAHYLDDGWIMGTDERLISTLRSDLMGQIGRVTR